MNFQPLVSTKMKFLYVRQDKSNKNGTCRDKNLGGKLRWNLDFSIINQYNFK